MTKVTIAGREIPLEFTGKAWDEIETEIGNPFELAEHMQGVGVMKRIRKYIRILGNAYLAKNHKNEDIADEWLESLPPSAFIDKSIKVAISEAIYNGLVMETNKPDEQVVDVTLQELEKKADAGC